MRFLVAVTTLLFASSLLASESDDGKPTDGLELFEPSVGVGVFLPEDWGVAAGDTGLIATSENKKAMVILMATKKNFSEEALKIDVFLKTFVFKDVKVDRATILLGEERGALEGAVLARGTAVGREDDKAVNFMALLVQSGEKGCMVAGAWKADKDARVVRSIVRSVYVKQPTKDAGIELREQRTGASIKLPAGWGVLASRKGLIAASPDKAGSILIGRSEHEFDRMVRETRDYLKENVFRRVELDEFAAVEKVGSVDFKRVVAARGKAEDRIDGKDVKFIVFAAESLLENRGVLIIGAWKDEIHEEAVRKALESLSVKKQE